MCKQWKKTEKEGFILIENEGGKKLGIAADSEVQILEADGFAFKDLAGSGRLEKYEDWRLSDEERAEDLVGRLSEEQIAGLMLYSRHQTVSTPKPEDLFNLRFAGTYNGKPFDPEKGDITELTDQQKEFLTKDKIRHILMTSVDSSEIAARWNNKIQAFCEKNGLGIPAVISSDPRHGASGNGEFFVGAGGMISQWPSTLGLAASFDPKLVEKFGRIMSREYRALGITTALSPQIDLASDPRWNRFNGTFGENSDMAAEMAAAYLDGAQTTEESETGWGNESVMCISKHWPGGGTGEGGRDAHFSYGKFAVYPGGNFEEHLKPFVNGALNLKGKTKKSAGIMPYYTVSYGIDTKYGENVGNAFSKYIIGDLLRDQYGYDGVVCTDWGVTDTCSSDYIISGMNWGVDQLTVAERHYKALKAGVDQFGGNNDSEPVLKAFRMLEAEMGREEMLKRIRTSAKRILKNFFAMGLFENPYVDPQESRKIVGCPDYMHAGYEAQKKSVILLKNKENLLPVKAGLKVYIPDCPDTMLYGMPALFSTNRDVPAHPWLGREQIERYFTVANTPQEADLAIVFMENPKPMEPGYTHEDGYLPLTLQYRPYTAEQAREQSIARGDKFSYDHPDRSYKGKTNTCANEKQLDVFQETRKQMGDKPVIAVLDVTAPMVLTEFESLADAILMGFEVQKQVYMDMITGKDEPSGLLPFQIPVSMETVEKHCEDIPGQLECHVDSRGNRYDFGYGLNFSGPIKDGRSEKYEK